MTTALPQVGYHLVGMVVAGVNRLDATLVQGQANACVCKRQQSVKNNYFFHSSITNHGGKKNF